MSLFKARDWWSTTVGEDEEFDLGCLCVANIDNASDELGRLFKDIHRYEEVKIDWKTLVYKTVNADPVFSHLPHGI